jgi:hypothetical protein
MGLAGIIAAAAYGLYSILLTVTAAFRGPSTNVAQLNPLVNANTLAVMVLGLIFFNELANGADLGRILIGGGLIAVGGCM